MEDLNLIEQLTLNDGTTQFELGNVKLNGYAEQAAIDGVIKEVRIRLLDIAKSTQVKRYETIVNERYDLSQEFKLVEQDDELKDLMATILKVNHIQ